MILPKLELSLRLKSSVGQKFMENQEGDRNNNLSKMAWQIHMKVSNVN